MNELNVIIGAGAVGLAIAQRLSAKTECLVLERNSSFGQETSSRNSEVIHAGIYYPTDSLKARLCVKGNTMLYQYLSENNLPYNKCGKYIIATKKSELDELNKIFELAKANQVSNIRKADSKEIKKALPQINCIVALFSEDTGIFDSHAYMASLEIAALKNNCDIAYNHTVRKIEKNATGYNVTAVDTEGNEFSIQANRVINAAGLGSDIVASCAGIDIEKYNYKLKFCRGHYYRLPIKEKYKFNHLIYPVPPSTNGLLGIHVTIDLTGSVRLGPDIQYLDKNIYDYHIPPETKPVFYDSVKAYIPALEMSDLNDDTTGMRPRLAVARDGFADFIIREESDKGLPNLINLIGIESPGLSSSLAIAEYVENMIYTRK